MLCLIIMFNVQLSMYALKVVHNNLTKVIPSVSLQLYHGGADAKEVHLFPYRTQKLSSLAAMVLGGRPPGRVARSHVIFFYFIL